MTDIAMEIEINRLQSENNALRSDMVQFATSRERFRKALEETLEALRGDDPDMLPSIQPIGWLYTAIEELKNPEQVAANFREDPDSFRMMIQELEWIYEKGSAAITAAEKQTENSHRTDNEKSPPNPLKQAAYEAMETEKPSDNVVRIKK